MAALVAAQGTAFARTARRSELQGQGYAGAWWRSSELVRAVAHLPATATVYSNAPDGIWLTVGGRAVRYSPGQPSGRSNISPPSLADFVRAVACEPSYLAWADDIVVDGLERPDRLRADVALTPVFRGSRGSVYRIDPLLTARGAAPEVGGPSCTKPRGP